MEVQLQRQVFVNDWGLMDYRTAWDRQTAVHQAVIHRKTNKELTGESGQDHLIFCQHHPVFTLGRSGKEDHLLMNEQFLKARGIDYYKINRGGDITYHGPGQIVLYPILDMEHFYTDVHRYVRSLENIIIKTLHEFELDAFRNPKYTGVWLHSRIDRKPKKICAIGVHMSRWVTLHGLAFNVETDLSPFDFIVPCGIQDPEKGVTSLHLESDKPIHIPTIQGQIAHFFEEEFQCTLVSKTMEV